MSYTDAISRIGQIQSQIASLGSAFVPGQAQSPSAASATAVPATTGSPSASPTGATTFSDALSGALAAPPTTTALAPTGGAGLPAKASSLLTSGQQQFASRLSADTGLDPGVVSAWVLSEESGGAASSRESAGNNDWLNIGYTDSGTFGSKDSVWSDPDAAADATAGWLKGHNTIPGYGTASSGVQAILGTAGRPPGDQIAALQGSGWASSGYPQLTSLYQQVAG